MTVRPEASREALESIGWGGIAADDRGRIARIAAEIDSGFQALRDVEPAVAFFGSARSPETAPEYAMARDVARAVARTGFSVITGGGPGIMEAANRGCREAGGLSVGLTIHLPVEQQTNRFVERECCFRYFFVRKLMFVKHSCAFLIFPGVRHARRGLRGSHLGPDPQDPALPRIALRRRLGTDCTGSRSNGAAGRSRRGSGADQAGRHA
jgi:hypothetical protein